MLTNSTSISSQCEAFSQVKKSFMNDMQPHLESIMNNIHAHLEEFWKLETIRIKEPCKETDDNKALENFNQTVKHKKERYHVQWPWK